jgi:hypothetical protein
MTDTSLNLSGKLPLTVQFLIEEIANVALLQNISFFIVGAFARDLILELTYGIRTQRATTDIDFGIRGLCCINKNGNSLPQSET